VLQIVLHLNEE